MFIGDKKYDLPQGGVDLCGGEKAIRPQIRTWGKKFYVHEDDREIFFALTNMQTGS